MEERNAYTGSLTAIDEPISIEYLTDSGRYTPAHWHEDLEMLYILNGTATVIADGIRHVLVPGECIVIDSNILHETQCVTSLMMISVHVKRDYLRSRAGGTQPFLIRCSRSDLVHEQLQPYLEICDMFRTIVPFYIRQRDGYRLMSEACILRILYLLVQHFRIPLGADDIPALTENRERVQKIASFIREHYSEKLTLSGTAEHFGLSEAYFSRLFRKNFGITFIQHLNRVRIEHIYHDLIATDEPVMELIEKHGFTSYKLFSRTFRQIYGCTPREVRQRSRSRAE